ncbi:MAG: sensor histidine kinase [Armatimonadota bacterium]
MRLRSFQLRVALLAVLVSGVVLSAFAGAAWLLVRRMDIARIDEAFGPPPLGARGGGRGEFAPDWSEVEEHVRGRYPARSDEPEPILLVVGRDGAVVYRSPEWPPDLPTDAFPSPQEAARMLPLLPRPPVDPRAGPGQAGAEPPKLHGPGFGTFPSRDGPWRAMIMASDEVTVVVGVSLVPHVRYMARVGLGFLAVLPAALLTIAGGSWWLARRALRPVVTLTEAAEGITARGLDQRIPVESEDREFRRLVTVFNEMMARLERSFNQAARFSADAAHELHTPLTIIQGELEEAIGRSPTGSEQQRRYSDLLAEVQRLRGIVSKLLLLAQADAGRLPLSPERINLSEMAEGLCEDADAMAPQLTVEARIAPDVYVMADADLLAQALHNLLTNAIKYNHDGGSVGIALTATEATVALTVTNTGPGIPGEHRERVFDRFYRVDPARGRTSGGAGLGLSLAREIALAHGGDLVLDEAPEGLTSFTLTLPASD